MVTRVTDECLREKRGKRGECEAEGEKNLGVEKKFFKVEIYFDDIVKIRKSKGGSLLKFEFRRYGKLYISNI